MQLVLPPHPHDSPAPPGVLGFVLRDERPADLISHGWTTPVLSFSSFMSLCTRLLSFLLCELPAHTFHSCLPWSGQLAPVTVPRSPLYVPDADSSLVSNFLRILCSVTCPVSLILMQPNLSGFFALWFIYLMFCLKGTCLAGSKDIFFQALIFLEARSLWSDLS